MNRRGSGGRSYLLNFNFSIIFGALISINLLKGGVVKILQIFNSKRDREKVYLPLSLLVYYSKCIIQLQLQNTNKHMITFKLKQNI